MSDITKSSRFLSLVLRHDPGRIGLDLDANGWAGVDDLIAKACDHGHPLDRETVHEIVATSDKQRFALSPDKTRIRANQGHSIDVDLGVAPAIPPPRLYHGTAGANLPSIRAEGLTPRNRQHVHLTDDPQTAKTVGARHGKPVVLVIAADAMHSGGHIFYRADNGVWLTDTVPPAFIRFPSESQSR